MCDAVTYIQPNREICVALSYISKVLGEILKKRNMKRLSIIFICFLSLNHLKASPQQSDFLIIGKDTVELYFLPLEQLDSTRLNKFRQNLIANKENSTSSLCLWREYQALWRLENNKLYLVGLNHNPNSDKIFKATFGNKYKNNKVFANWFSSRLAIAKDKVLRWDELFSRTYIKEEVFDFKLGRLENKKLVENYIKVENGIPRLTKEQAEEAIGNRIKQINRPKTIFRYWVTIDERGKISDIKFDNFEKFTGLATEQFKEMQFDVVKWNGEPYKETIFMEIL